MKEIWRDINGWKGRYQISNLGKVKSLAREDSKGRNVRERILKSCKDIHGYLRISFYKEGARKMKAVHRLVLEAFKRNPENKLDTNHLNGIKTDNRIDNLEFATRSENMIHAFSNGLAEGPKGERNGKSKLTEKQVRIILWALYFGAQQKELAKIFTVSKTIISKINIKSIWRHVTI